MISMQVDLSHVVDDAVQPIIANKKQHLKHKSIQHRPT
jgi:hypothetical protein